MKLKREVGERRKQGGGKNNAQGRKSQPIQWIREKMREKRQGQNECEILKRRRGG